MDGQEDDVVQEAQRLVVVTAHHLVDQFHELLGAEHLGRVQAAIDPHDGFALRGQRVRVLVREAFG